MLGRCGIAERQIRLEEIDPGRGAMAFGIVEGGDQLGDGGDVPGGTQIAGYPDQHVGAGTGRGGEDLFIDFPGAIQIAQFELFERGFQSGRHRSGEFGFNRRITVGGNGRRGLRGGWCGRFWFRRRFADQSIKESHIRGSKRRTSKMASGFLGRGPLGT